MPKILNEILRKYVDDVHGLLEHFNKWIRVYPFYNNIKREGVELYAD